MTTSEKQALIAKIETLPSEEQEKVRAFVRQLIDKAGDEEVKPRYLSQDWAGALRHLKDEYTSLELEDDVMEQWLKSARD
jgi:uncharacterized protein YfaT (DUF1175 family)